MARVYVASSWRNSFQPAVVLGVGKMGHEVYDFRYPAAGEHGFSWREIDPDWGRWTVDQYAAALEHETAKFGFALDMEALRACDICLLVMPCGQSAHLELGWAVGAGKMTGVLFPALGDGLRPVGHPGYPERSAGPCPDCGDLDGCHLPSRLERPEPELMRKMCDAPVLRWSDVPAFLTEDRALPDDRAHA